MQDRPSATELLEAIAAFLGEEAVPALQGRTRFHALVAANVARILVRELQAGRGQLQREYRALWALLDKNGDPPQAAGPTAAVEELNRELCRRIAAGQADREPWRARLLAHLRGVVADKLEVNNPGFVR